MTDMVDELIVWEGSLNLEVRIFSEQEKLEPLVDSFSSSTIGASLIGSDVWDKVGWGNIILIRPTTSLLAPWVDEIVCNFWVLEVLKTGEDWSMGIVWA